MPKSNNEFSITRADIIPTDLLQIIEEHYPTFSPSLKSVADYIKYNPVTFCFLPVQELATRAGVSHATVMRFCKSLGYTGFLEFSRDAQQIMQAGLSGVNRFEITKNYLTNPKEKQSFFATAMNMEIQAMVDTVESISYENVTRCVDMLVRADNIFVAGFMGSFPLAMHLEQVLSKVSSKVHLIPTWSSQTVASLHRITPHSVLIAIAFPRYPTLTIEFVKAAHERKCSIIAITNGQISPLNKFADRCLHVPVSMLSYADLYAAPIAVCTALALEFSTRDPQKSTVSLAKFDKIIAKQHLFTR